MVTAFWSVTGGSGVTVTTLLTALHLSRRHHESVLIVDLDGEVPAAAGIAVDPAGGPAAGIAEWTRLGSDVRPDSLERLVRPLAPGLEVLPRGSGPLRGDRVPLLAQLLERRPGPVVCDLGLLRGTVNRSMLLRAVHRSVLVSRCCYLSLRRATAWPDRIDGIVTIVEPGRALAPDDLGRVLDRPVLGRIAHDPAIARLVDAGLLLRRPPRQLERLDGIAAETEAEAEAVAERTAP